MQVNSSFKKFLWWLPVLILTLINLALSLMTWEEVRQSVGWVKTIPQNTEFKLRHIVQFAPLSIFTVIALNKTTNFTQKKIYWVTIAVFSFEAIFSEFVQVFVPSRIPAIADIAWSMVGGGVGLILVVIYENLAKRQVSVP